MKVNGKGVIVGNRIDWAASGKRVSFRINSSFREKTLEGGYEFKPCYIDVDVRGAKAVAGSRDVVGAGNLVCLYDAELQMNSRQHEGKTQNFYKLVTYEVPGLVPMASTNQVRNSSQEVTPRSDEDLDELPF